MLSPRQLAFAVMLATAGLLMSATTQSAELQIRNNTREDKVYVFVGNKLFTSYKYDEILKKPYFHPIVGPKSGKTVTVESTQPYPHHNSLWIGCDRVNGGDYWQEGLDRGHIVSQGPKIVKESGDSVVFTDECLWQRPGHDPVIRDKRRVEISAPDDNTRYIDFQITMEPLVDVTIQRTNHSLFSARMRPELSVKQGGTLINAEGDQKEKGTFGVSSPWMDYYGTRDGVTEGLAILQNPNNRWYPSKWFTRDYGFMSPTPMYFMDSDEMHLPKGEALTLNYRVVVHAGDVKQADIAGRFQEYKAQAEKAKK